MDPFEIPADKNQFRYIFTEDLYLVEEGKTVVEPAQKEIATKMTSREKKAAGKDLAVIVLNEKEKSQYSEFLSKIMQAININPAKADIFSREDVDKALNNSYPIYISFGEGLRKTGTGIALKMNQVLTEGESRFLLTDTLSAMETDKEKKKALWTAMQKGLLNG